MESAEWGKMAIFLYAAALNHFLSDLLNHWMEKKGVLLVLHCLLYAIFFIPLFWWMEINSLWLILVFASHLLIDWQTRREKNVERLVKKILSKTGGNAPYSIITAGLDQILHLLVLFIVALFIFVFK